MEVTKSGKSTKKTAPSRQRKAKKEQTKETTVKPEAIEEVVAVAEDAPPASKKYVLLQAGTEGDTILPAESMSSQFKNGLRRKMRYIEGADTIFVDEQGDVSNIQLRPIMIERGTKLVRDPLLMQYMDYSEHNQANGGKVFKELNEEAEAQKRLEASANIDTARYTARTMEMSDVRDVSRALGFPNVHLTSDAAAREKLLGFATQAPDTFLEMVESPLPKAVSIIQRAFETGALRLQNGNREIAWRGGTSIRTIPFGFENNYVEWLAKWMLSTEDGKLFSESLEEAMK